jgi:hypothetical protein
MSFNEDLYNQEFIDKYFKGWIGVSFDLPDNPETKPMALNLEFNSKCSATAALLFLYRWQVFSAGKKLWFSMVEEADGHISCYFYTPGYPYRKQGRFKKHVNFEKLRRFVELQKKYPAYQIVTRFADQNFDVCEAGTQNIIIFLDSLTYRKREKVTKGELEFE